MPKSYYYAYETIQGKTRQRSLLALTQAGQGLLFKWSAPELLNADKLPDFSDEAMLFVLEANTDQIKSFIWEKLINKIKIYPVVYCIFVTTTESTKIEAENYLGKYNIAGEVVGKPELNTKQIIERALKVEKLLFEIL